jgi:anthranilate phosphoribosyltransferase
MPEIEQFTAILDQGADLSREQAARAASLLTDSEVHLDEKRKFLVALSEKGESPIEVAAFASTFRDLAVDPGVEAWSARAIDVCGTGGDGAQTFNISTAVSFIVAASGVPVFKHGNRSITSKCGSADLLEALGFDLETPLERQKASLDALNYCFFFAPAYHPAFKEVMPVRKALAAEGHRSIFNLLGPLINPGKPAFQLLGVYQEGWVGALAETLDALGLRSGVVAHGRPKPEQGLDELSCAGSNQVAGFGQLRDLSALPPLAAMGLEACEFSSLQGGDVADNVRTLRALAKGTTSAVAPGLRDSILLNAGVALWVVGQTDSPLAGVETARETIASGKLQDWMQRAEDFYRSE